MKDRILSVDVLRGLTIMLMTIVNNPGDWGNVHPPFLHAEWHGATPTDLVFPFFLFIVGVSVVLAMPEKQPTPSTYEKIAVRTLRIFCLGLFLNFFSKIYAFELNGIPLLILRLSFTSLAVVAFLGNYNRKMQLYVALGAFVLMLTLAFSGLEQFESVRLPGVLQRIAIVYGVVSLLYLHTDLRVQALVAVLILLGYWAIMTLVPLPNGTQPNVEVSTNLAAYIDEKLLTTHNWASSKTWDPEGILSTIPATATGIIGLLIGRLLVSETARQRKPLLLLGVGLAGVIMGLVWNVAFPINKALWTSSYVLYTAGLATLTLGVLYYLTDIRNARHWTKPFIVFGVNAMVVFFFSGIIPRVLSMIKFTGPTGTNATIDLQSYIYSYGILPFFDTPKDASLAAAFIYLLIWFVILTLFYRKNLIFKV